MNPRRYGTCRDPNTRPPPFVRNTFKTLLRLGEEDIRSGGVIVKAQVGFVPEASLIFFLACRRVLLMLSITRRGAKTGAFCASKVITEEGGAARVFLLRLDVHKKYRLSRTIPLKSVLEIPLSYGLSVTFFMSLRGFLCV